MALIIAAMFFGGSLALFLLVVIIETGKAKHKTSGEVLEFRKRGQRLNIRV